MDKKKIIIGSLSGLLILGLAVSAYGFKYLVDGRIPAGTTISGLDISYKTKEEAKLIVEKTVKEFLNKDISIKINNDIVTLKPEEINLNFKVNETLEPLSVIDAAKTSTLDIITGANGQELVLDYEMDKDEILNKIDDELKLSYKAPKAAGFYYVNGELVSKEGENGYLIDGEDFERQLEEKVKNFDDKSIEISLIEAIPSIKTTDIEGEKERILKELNKTITLVDPVYSDNWTLKLADNPEMVSFKEAGGSRYNFLKGGFEEEGAVKDGSIVNISLNDVAFNAYLDKDISKWLDKPVDSVNISKDDKGQIVVEGHGKDGQKVERVELKNLIEDALSTDVEKIEIPVIVLKPELKVSKDLEELGIKERIAVGHSSYYNSPANRRFNIELGASKFNAHLFAPGEEFSFNTTLGPVEYSTGYKPELVIKGGDLGTRPEPGGGICQVSTTMYRAALAAGLPITDRRSHSYKVGYYAQVMGDGLDATIYIGGQDLKFKNDTGSHILMQTYIDKDYELYIVFYGSNNDGRVVELEGPFLSNYHSPGPTIVKETKTLPPGARKQVEKSHTGFDALWYRHIKYADGKTVKEELISNYKAIPARILVGAGAAAPAAE